jgi:L-proline amide hydrolase
MSRLSRRPLSDDTGFAPFGAYRTWYRVRGDVDSGKPPLVVVHGGPGCTHDYLLAYGGIAETGRAVVFYDQVGNGRSTHLPDKPDGFWTVELFLDELDNLLAHLGIRERYDLLGQSWGGMLAAEHAVLRPPGLNALVIANSPASMALWLEAAEKLRQALPADVQRILLQHEADGSYRHPDYQIATRFYYERHVCRAVPWPGEVVRTFDAVDADPTVYGAMGGPNEFHIIGTLKNWTIIDRLDRIAAPTLILSGLYDEAAPEVVEPFLLKIADSRWRIFHRSSHMPHVEETEACLQEVARFLDGYD